MRKKERRRRKRRKVRKKRRNYMIVNTCMNIWTFDRDNLTPDNIRPDIA